MREQGGQSQEDKERSEWRGRDVRDVPEGFEWVPEGFIRHFAGHETLRKLPKCLMRLSKCAQKLPECLRKLPRRIAKLPRSI